MKTKVRMRLNLGFLGLLSIGSVVSVTAKTRYATEYLRLRQKQEAIIADIEKETIRLKGVALQSAESSDSVTRATTWALVLVTGLGLVVKSGLQVVPGIAFPIGVGPSHGQRALFLYLSLEHSFRTSH